MSNPVRRFFADTRDMVLDGLARLGLIRGGSVWFRHRMQRRLDALGGEAENVRRSVATKYRMCRECRALVPTSERTCPECGASMSGIPKGGVSRALSLIAPSFGSASSSLLGLILVVYAATALTSGAGLLGDPTRSPLTRAGAMVSPLIWQYGEYWRLLTAVFLHGSILHIAFNALALANIGPALEASIGSRRTLGVFMLTGIGSFVGSSLVHPVSLGASGAIYGLIGYGIVHGRVRGGTMYRAFSDNLLRWAFFGLLMSLTGQIDMAAHVTGLVIGCVLGLVVARGRPRHAWLETAWTIATVVFVLLIPACFALALNSLR